MTTDQVWEQYHQDLKSFILSKVKDTIVADDILQDTFVRIHTKLHTLKDPSKVKSWIFSIARNATIDHFKNQNTTFYFPEMEVSVDPEKHLHSEKDCLRGIIKNLPKKYRDPLFLSDIRGMQQQAIADQLQLPLPTVKSQIQRARKLVAQGFMDCCGYTINKQGKLVGELQDKGDCKVCK